mmetsp:Transcript_70950/g.164015  ORF Transcript_70950/g.164015 Transcript_70950/m.164015 type:complete len:244 (-) Transcript_70950:82-813(-)
MSSALAQVVPEPNSLEGHVFSPGATRRRSALSPLSRQIAELCEDLDGASDQAWNHGGTKRVELEALLGAQPDLSVHTPKAQVQGKDRRIRLQDMAPEAMRQDECPSAPSSKELAKADRRASSSLAGVESSVELPFLGESALQVAGGDSNCSRRSTLQPPGGDLDNSRRSTLQVEVGSAIPDPVLGAVTTSLEDIEQRVEEGKLELQAPRQSQGEDAEACEVVEVGEVEKLLAECEELRSGSKG